MAIKLKACPFCGGDAKAKSQRVAEDAEEAWVECAQCEARSLQFEGAYAPHDQAADYWNRREPGSVSLVGADIKAVMDFVVPDNGREPDQLETPVTIAWLSDGHSGPGYYAYFSEYPEEGCIHLDNDKSEPATSAAS